MSSNFRVSYFRSRVVVWMLLAIFLWSLIPSISIAQQPTATISALSGEVLVSGQAATVGTVLQAGDTVQTQAGASAVLELSDESKIELGEKTQINIDDLAQTATGARVSYIKLLSGWLRAFLSPKHQQEGSSFTIETPNAQLGAKFSQPDVEVSYDPEKQETVGIAHTVELIATNLLTGETKLVPVGSTVIITAVGMKVIAGIVGIVGTSSAGSTGTGTASTTASTGSTGMGTGTKVALGLGAAAAAGGVAAVAASSGDGGESETAESTGDLSGIWQFSGSGIVEGCPLDLVGCCTPWVIIAQRPCCGNGPIYFDGDFHVKQSGNMLSATDSKEEPPSSYTLDGIVNGSSVSFTIQGIGYSDECPGPTNTTYTGVIDRNTIRGDFSGFGNWEVSGRTGTLTWAGIFTVNIRKE